MCHEEHLSSIFCLCLLTKPQDSKYNKNPGRWTNECHNYHLPTIVTSQGRITTKNQYGLRHHTLSLQSCDRIGHKVQHDFISVFTVAISNPFCITVKQRNKFDFCQAKHYSVFPPWNVAEMKKPEGTWYFHTFNGNVFAISFESCESISRWCHSRQSREQNWPWSLGKRDGITRLLCVALQCKPITGGYELMCERAQIGLYAECVMIPRDKEGSTC